MECLGSASMSNKKILSGIVATCALAASASMSHASGYIGASIGRADYGISAIQFDDSTSFTLYGGYKVNQNFALEVSYVDLGESEDNIDPVWTIDAEGFNFSAVGIIPANEIVDVFAKVGVYAWDFSVSEAGFGEIYSNDGTDVSFGFGVSVNLAKQFDLVFEYQQVDVDDEGTKNISFGARYNF
jgi:hypothetical protein